jgi:hypothetical protein
MPLDDPIEEFWNDILSRNAERTLKAFSTLNVNEQQSIYIHLQRMASEPGWHIEQVLSAQAALRVLNIENHETK